MTEKYPKYNGFEMGDDLCWEIYAEKIKKMKNSDEWYDYPLDAESETFNPRDEYKSFDPRSCKVIDLEPEEFIRLAAKKTHIRGCSLNYLFDAFEFGKPKLDPAFLEVWFDDYDSKCEIVGHEGRHRAEISNDIEISDMPTVVCWVPRRNILLGSNDLYRKWEKEGNEKGFTYELAKKYSELSKPYPETCNFPDIKPEMKGESEYERYEKRRYYGLE